MQDFGAAKIPQNVYGFTPIRMPICLLLQTFQNGISTVLLCAIKNHLKDSGPRHWITACIHSSSRPDLQKQNLRQPCCFNKPVMEGGVFQSSSLQDVSGALNFIEQKIGRGFANKSSRGQLKHIREAGHNQARRCKLNKKTDSSTLANLFMIQASQSGNVLHQSTGNEWVAILPRQFPALSFRQTRPLINSNAGIFPAYENLRQWPGS